MGLCSSRSKRILFPFVQGPCTKINLKFLLYVCKNHQTFGGSCSNSIPCGFLRSSESCWKESCACIHAILYAIVVCYSTSSVSLITYLCCCYSHMSLTGSFCLFSAPTICFFFSFQLFTQLKKYGDSRTSSKLKFPLLGTSGNVKVGYDVRKLSSNCSHKQMLG